MAELILMGIIIILVGVMNILCFMIGARVGQKVNNDEPIELPNLDPLKAAREHREQRENKREQDKYDAILRNIENYDGTDRGQEDIPQ